ncbi:pyridoxal phosphate phosphatase PHOSPHO2 [Cololabis saira]|uniref:pyridoxal phosphate phosphatase PHOSPHO2 n=1 Tax=Cololabis saira TaxID=129043 RepID=UPI002AD2F15E|nr:pyridoxal phosphate phosphatase PHOSPHO2 [Cololabis saira]XP_061602677.1 pyridoxal phosphate phosphatase PHOSPHO2 [Cololabis saira]
MRVLMVFDFDHTLVDDNSDTWVIKCLPGETLPDSVRLSYRKGHWTEFMGRVMSHIGEQRVSAEQIRVVMETIPFTAGMPELLSFIAQNKNAVDCIVVSDSNSVFIHWILAAAGLGSAVDQVFTNPAEFGPSGALEVRPHHDHACPSCPVNLCKRAVLEEFLARRAAAGTGYGRVLYVGDGGNDLCPTAALRGHDVALPRRGYSLEKLLARQEVQDQQDQQNKQGAQDGAPLRARVVPWSSGAEVLQELKDAMTAL